jgi:hypothetical protein
VRNPIVAANANSKPMRTRTGTGTTDTIFVIVRVSGEERVGETIRRGDPDGRDVWT